MKKRWIIRSFFIALLVACVAVWVASYFGGLSVRVDYQGRIHVVDAVQGETFFAVIYYPGLKPNVYFRFQRYMTANDWAMDVRFPGFRYSENKSVEYPRVVGIAETEIDRKFWMPIWFPTLLLAGFLWFVWRKTKPNPIGGAFPIEPGTNSGGSKP